MEALSPFMALALLFMLAFIVPASILLIFDDSQPWSGRLIMGAIAALLTPGFVAGIFYLLKISLFNRYANLRLQSTDA